MRASHLQQSSRVHVAISADGTEIIGRRRGQGSALVLMHGGWGDGELAYEALVPHLADRFTCYTPSTRGRGLSGASDDFTVRRLGQDVVAFVDNLDEPAYLVGWSGTDPVLVAAESSPNVAAVALFEAYVPAVASDDDLAVLGETIGQVGAAAADGRLSDAARAIGRYVMTDREFAVADDDFFERWAKSIPAMLGYFRQNMNSESARPFLPEELGNIKMPLLALFGGDTTHPVFLADSARHLATHAQRGSVRELPEVGHFAPVFNPEPLADALVEFFALA